LKHVVLAGDPAVSTSMLLARAMGDIRVSVKRHCPFPATYRRVPPIVRGTKLLTVGCKLPHEKVSKYSGPPSRPSFRHAKTRRLSSVF
jgi:hypothetical protein